MNRTNPLIITKKENSGNNDKKNSNNGINTNNAKKPSIRDFFPSWIPYELGLRRTPKQTKRFTFDGNNEIYPHPRKYSDNDDSDDSDSEPEVKKEGKKRGRPPNKKIEEDGRFKKRGVSASPDKKQGDKKKEDKSDKNNNKRQDDKKDPKKQVSKKQDDKKQDEKKQDDKGPEVQKEKRKYRKREVTKEEKNDDDNNEFNDESNYADDAVKEEKKIQNTELVILSYPSSNVLGSVFVHPNMTLFEVRSCINEELEGMEGFPETEHYIFVSAKGIPIAPKQEEDRTIELYLPKINIKDLDEST